MTTGNVISNKRKLALASVTMVAVLAASRPNVLSKVYASANMYDWTKQEDLDRLGGQYSSAARSANGTHLILGVEHGGENSGHTSPLFISQDSGTTWENVADEIDATIQYNWSTVDVSNNGQTMVAASTSGWKVDNSGFEPGKIFASENGGDTWADITPEESDNWQGVVVSGDGSTIAAIEWGEGVVHLTEDAGDNWTNTSINEDINNTKSISMSDNGDKILVGGENGNDNYTYLYFSENGGDTWADITPNADGNTHDIQTDMSADGNKITATSMGWADGGNDSVFISNNGGLSWDTITPGDGTPAYWADIAMSDNASTLSVLDDQNNKMYVSSDLGANWTEEDPGQEYEDSNAWVSLDMNEDGSKPVVASEENAYLSGNLVTPESESKPTVTFDNAEGGKTVTLTTPAGTTITCHSAVKESSLTGKDIAYSYPLGLVDFCFSGADLSNGVSLTFVTDLMPSQVVARKYNPTSGAYSTITTATINETTLEGKHALRVSYNIEDNGPLDTDTDIGEVADPVGLGRADIAVPNTGFEKTTNKI